MKEKIFMQKILRRTVAVFTLLSLCLASCMVTGIKAYADTPIDNPQYTLTTTNDTKVATTANADQTTVLIFGYIGCSKTRSTLSSISSCEWVKRSDIRVIFAETNGNTKEEVLAYERGYQCPNMIFCYDTSDIIFKVMADYTYRVLGTYGGSYPTIVLIDKNNKIQSLMQGTTTANGILEEIKKFEDIDDEETGTPPLDADSGIENIVQGLTTIENETVSTKANPNETTVLLFGYTTCGKTKATLQSIDQSSWVSRPDIRVIFADVYSAAQSEVTNFAQDYTSGDIIFCYDESTLNYKLAFSYLNLFKLTGGTFPWIILIDQNNKVQSLTMDQKTADEILAEIEKFTNAGQTPEDTPKDTPEDTPKDTPEDTSKDTSGVSNVTGLKAVSAARKVKLTWNKVSDANGYIVYQYDNSKKTWSEKATIKTNTASYTIKKLDSGSQYRFAVKAFKTQNGKQITSDSYASLYTATAPAAVKFKVTPGKKKVTIKWNKVKGATGYIVYYKTKAKASWKELKSTKGVSYKKKKLKSGATYYFTVKAYKTYKNETYTSSFSAKKVVVK